MVMVRDILAQKGASVNAVKPTDTVGTLCQLLKDKRVGAAIVSANGQTIEGVITERDITYALAAHPANLAATLVSTLMTKSVITCAPDDDVALVASTMLSRNIRHIPVAVDGRPVGMVSIRDVLRLRLDDLQQQTAQLKTFVKHASRPPQDRE